MAKSRFSLSKKHNYMIDKLCEIPSLEEINNSGWIIDGLKGIHTDYRYNTEDILIMIIENLTTGTQQEDIGKEICEKARVIFDFYADKEK